MTQFLTGHGKFATCLKKYKITGNSISKEYKEETSPDHTFKECKKFEQMREKYTVTEEDLEKCLQEGSGHHQVRKYIKEILENKDKIE